MAKNFRDEDIAATSGIITPVQETSSDIHRGFLTYLPVYMGNITLSKLSKRQRLVLGCFYAPFRAGDLMRGILGNEDKDIVFDIYDGEGMDSYALLCSSVYNNDDPGIAAEFHEQIFKMFTTLRPTDDVEGSTFSFTWPIKIESLSEETEI